MEAGCGSPLPDGRVQALPGAAARSSRVEVVVGLVPPLEVTDGGRREQLLPGEQLCGHRGPNQLTEGTTPPLADTQENCTQLRKHTPPHRSRPSSPEDLEPPRVSKWDVFIFYVSGSSSSSSDVCVLQFHVTC
ncbi:unnamed protein product [Pleuronectes platessa]|uniref:Uncharacterized protein n=1 Tax=Pleuronectes platessa TaxID=8262 RepID=A0A9N7TRQ9_PLEPL|nr:unnamed protein product [Pleuronectes platessa]